MHAAVGRDFARDLLPVQGGDGVYRVSGLVTPPRACRASRGAQYFYVNGRYVKNRTMMAALENAYKGTLMQGKFPGGVLMLTMPAELVDVNVHPAKTEIRFARRAMSLTRSTAQCAAPWRPPAAASAALTWTTARPNRRPARRQGREPRPDRPSPPTRRARALPPCPPPSTGLPASWWRRFRPARCRA